MKQEKRLNRMLNQVQLVTRRLVPQTRLVVLSMGYALLLMISSSVAAFDYEHDYVPPSSVVRILGGEIQSTVSQSSRQLSNRYNQEQKVSGINGVRQSIAIPISSAGSRSSISDLIEGRAEFAIVSADAANELYRSADKLGMAGIEERVRLVTAVAPSVLHVVVRRENQRTTELSSLKGKRISIGFPASMLGHTIGKLMASHGIDIAGPKVFYYPTKQAIKHLEEKKLDAVFILDQAPSSVVTRLLESGDYTLAPVQSHLLVEEEQTQVANGLNEISVPFYPGLKPDFVTVMQDNYLLTQAIVSDPTVKAIKRMSDNFRSEIPSLIPLHDALIQAPASDNAQLDEQLQADGQQTSAEILSVEAGDQP